jgi:hypothetical protein
MDSNKFTPNRSFVLKDESGQSANIQITVERPHHLRVIQRLQIHRLQRAGDRSAAASLHDQR